MLDGKTIDEVRATLKLRGYEVTRSSTQRYLQALEREHRNLLRRELLADLIADAVVRKLGKKRLSLIKGKRPSRRV